METAQSIADQLLRDVKLAHPYIHDQHVLLSLALLRSCRELQVYRASDAALNAYFDQSEGLSPQDAVSRALVPGDREPSPPHLSPERSHPVQPVSGESSVTCPNCGTENELHPSPYLRYLCFECGYTETDV